MGQVDLVCCRCHKLILQIEAEEVSGYWAFAIICDKCEGKTDEGLCKQCTD